MDPQNNPQRVFTPDKPASPPPSAVPPAPGTEEYKPRDLSSLPYGANTPLPPSQTQVPAGPSNSINDPPEKGRKLPKGPLIAGIVGGVVVLALILAAVLAGGDKPKQTQQPTTNNTQSPALQPAQSVELEQTSNALSQDLSRLDDERDLPNNSLEDQTLGL